MSLFEVKAEISAVHADAADDIMLELGVEGWSLLQDVIVQRAWIVGIFTSEEEAHARSAELWPLLDAAQIARLDTPVVRALADQDWRDSYKAHFKAWKFGRLHWVPIWERDQFQLPAGEAVIWLDPGLAFGTGNHETTRLCVERLVPLIEKRGTALRVIDAGCGSGILALSAARLGVREVLGFDNDPEAVRVSDENTVLNGLVGQVPFRVGDLVSGLAGKMADIVLANIQSDVLMRFVGELTRAVAPGGALILSGILSRENEQVRTAFAAVVPSWSMEHREMGEWSDVQLIRPL